MHRRSHPLVLRELRNRVSAMLGLALMLIAVLVPSRAEAGKRSMIPPGREGVIAELVERALAAEGAASLQIDRDRIRVSLPDHDSPRWVLFHPEAEVMGEIGESLAPGVVIECGPAQAARKCDEAERERWRSAAMALARERDALVDQIWQVEESAIDGREPVIAGEARERPDWWLDRILVALALLGGLAILAMQWRRGMGIATFESIGLGMLLSVFLVGVLSSTSLWPLHEHNSFVARADCAVDPRCLDDPASAWSPTSLNAWGMILDRFGLGPPSGWSKWIAVAGLGLSMVTIVLVWALARRLIVELGRPMAAPWAGLVAAAVLCTHPVHWRLAGAGTMWPLAIAAVLTAALIGLWAAAQASPWTRLTAWSIGGCWFGVALGGNIVLLTLAPLAVFAPLVWNRHGARGWVAAAGALPLLLLLVASDLAYAWTRVGESGGGELTVRHLAEFDPLLFDWRFSALVWAPLVALGLAWLVPALARRAGALGPSPARAGWRVLTPILLGWLVPHLFLGRAAGAILGSGYPVGFINHHWELVGSAIVTGLGGAWLVAVLAERGNSKSTRVGASFVLGTSTLALALAPLAGEGWRFASETLVVERELASLDQAVQRLPRHDRLILAPKLLPRLAGVEGPGDPIEVAFPLTGYGLAHGREPALDFIAALEWRPVGPDERVLIYVGTSLRSFLPEEIAAGVVPDSLERPELEALSERYALSPALEFELDTRQHEAASMRLGADRSETLTLGFYWLTPHRLTK